MGRPAARRRQLRALVGGVLRDTRVAHDLTQVDVARRLGRAQSYVSKYESGELRVDLVALVEICAAIDVRVVVLVERVAEALGLPAAPTAMPLRRSAAPDAASDASRTTPNGSFGGASAPVNSPAASSAARRPSAPASSTSRASKSS